MNEKRNWPNIILFILSFIGSGLTTLILGVSFVMAISEDSYVASFLGLLTLFNVWVMCVFIGLTIEEINQRRYI